MRLCVRFPGHTPRIESTKMRYFSAITVVSSSLLLLVPFGNAGEKNAGEKLEWRWSKNQAKLEYCIKRHFTNDYEVELLKKDKYHSAIKIRDKSGRVVFSFEEGRLSLVFTRWRDTLFVAAHSHIASGCEVVAVDLQSGKTLWKTRLQGIGPIEHSQYLNRINIDTDGKRIIVYGNEANGRYIEHLDLKTGKMLVNKKLPADVKSLDD